MKVLHMAVYWERWPTLDLLPWWQFWRSGEPFYPRQLAIKWLYWQLAFRWWFRDQS